MRRLLIVILALAAVYLLLNRHEVVKDRVLLLTPEGEIKTIEFAK
jgi:hypothetical protein